MDTEKVDFDLATALREAFASARDEEATEARLALQSIEQTLASKFGERLSNATSLVAYFGSLAGLANNALKEGLDKTCHKYLLLLSKLLSIVFAHSDTHPELANKSLALLNSMPELANTLVTLAKRQKSLSRPVVSILRYSVYAKRTDLKVAFAAGGTFVEGVRLLFDALIHEKQPIRKEAGKAIHFMLENGFADSSNFIKSFDSFCRFNLENWFIQPQRAQYTLYTLSTCLSYFAEETQKEYVELLLRIIDGKSTVDLSSLACIVVENLFANKHLGNTYTRDLVLKLIDISERVFAEATHPNQLTSIVQSLVQVFLNYNSGAPSLAKDILPRVLDICSELLCLNPEEITVFDAATVTSIKERVTKNIELLLLMSCDEYLFPNDDSLDFFGAMSIQQDVLDSIREKEGVGKGQAMTPRRRLLVTLKNLLSSRFEVSMVYVLNILDSFCTKLHQLGIAQQDSTSEDLLELMLEIRHNIGFNHFTEKCMGNFASKINLEILLKALPIKVLDIDMSSPEFDQESNAFLLSLLAIYKSKARFSTFYTYLWPQLTQISALVRQHTQQTRHIDKVVHSRLTSIQNQYLSILKKSVVFPDADADNFCLYLTDLLTSLLSLDEKETVLLGYIGEPLKFLLVALLSQKQQRPQVYADALGIINEKSLMTKLCKLNNKLEHKVGFVSDSIKILVLMLSRPVAANIITKNVNRLQTFFHSCTDFKSAQFEKGLRDLETVTQMVSVFKDLHTENLYHELIKFLKTLFAVDNERAWKKAANLAQSMINNVHHSYCAGIFEIVTAFFDERLKGIKSNRKKRTEVAHTMMADEKIKSRKIKQRLQGIVLKVANEFVKSYFSAKIEELAPTGGPRLEKVGEELSSFCDSYLPIAVICMKNKSGKTRDQAKSLIFKLDEVFTQITGDNKTLLSMVLAGLAGKTSLMKSATIQVAGLMLEKKDEELETDYKVKIAEVITLMLKDQNKETFHAVLTFLRQYVKLMDSKTLQQQLPDILTALYEFDPQSAQNSTKLMTMLLERLVKKVGEEEVRKSLPENEKNVLRYIRRQDKRQTKLKARKKAAEFETRLKSRNEVDISSKTLDENHARRVATGRAAQQQRKTSDSGMNLEPTGNGGGRFGMQDPSTAEDLLLRFDASKEAFHFTKHHVFQLKANNKAEEGKAQKQGTEDRGDVYFDEETNKLVVKDKKGAKSSSFKRKADVLDDVAVGSDDESDDDKKTKAEDKNSKSRKDGKNGKGAQGQEEETLAARMLKKYGMKQKKENGHFIRESGELYKAKGSTRGDVMIPGKAAPHAFVQLNPMALQKKNRDKASEIYGYLVNKKKSGMLKGLVSKSKK